MKLFHFADSSASYRVRICLALKGVDVEYRSLNLCEGEHRAQGLDVPNKQGLVPYLQLEDGRVIGQSIAIMEYLEEYFPTPYLWPADMTDRALARGIAQQIASDVSPFQKTTFQNDVKQIGHVSDTAVSELVEKWMMRGLSPIETEAQDRLGRTGFLFEASPGIAECCIIPQLHNARRWGLSMDALPKLLELETRCLELEAFKNAHPDNWRN